MIASPLDRLSDRDVEIVRQCLAAAVRGPFFPDWEFGTLMGLTRDEVQDVLLTWPASGDEERAETLRSTTF